MPHPNPNKTNHYKIVYLFRYHTTETKTGEKLEVKTHNLKMVKVAFSALLMLLGGCSSKTDELYQDSIQKGLDAIAEDNFSKAQGLFEVALEAKGK